MVGQEGEQRRRGVGVGGFGKGGWAPRSRRKRVINQAAVSALADEWQPGLHQHQLDETGGGPSEPIESAERRPCYPVHHACLMRRRIHVSYEEEDTCVL